MSGLFAIERLKKIFTALAQFSDMFSCLDQKENAESEKQDVLTKGQSHKPELKPTPISIGMEKPKLHQKPNLLKHYEKGGQILTNTSLLQGYGYGSRGNPPKYLQISTIIQLVTTF